MKKVAIYVRCSTDKGQDLDTQILPLKEYVANRGWEVYKIYQDYAESGSKQDRKALKELMDDARRRKFHVCAVARWDRFSRSTRQLLESLETFRAVGVDFVSLHNATDTTTPEGKMFFTIIAGFAEYERELIRSRVLDGLNKARAKGKTLGRPKVPIDIQKLFQLKSEGLSIRKIAEELKVPKSTVQNYI
ncbi:MAG TPA: recombinase family protein [Patescibacteria group bacterium]|nr:recombinase family protein [Patescibacteria group bacterium]